jgi:hypothetical protein
LRSASNASAQFLAGTLQLVPVQRAVAARGGFYFAGLILSFGVDAVRFGQHWCSGEFRRNVENR